MKSTLSISFLFTTISILFSIGLQGQIRTNKATQNEELGDISWFRDYDKAMAQGAKENKAVLILFQEVPGCATCRNYGHNVLSHPLMVDAIENEFIPLAIFNNKGGKDREVLKKYNEPSWNNPVVRIVNTNGDDLVKRVAGNYSAKALHAAMVKALQSEKKKVPEYIKLLGKELAFEQANLKEKHYSMYCFWTGEGHLGNLDGVLSVEAGFIGYKEVVKVNYDADKISEKELDEYAKKGSCSNVKNVASYRASEKDHLYYLKHSNFRYLPLSEIQKNKINSALGKRQSPLPYLSPTQKSWFAKLDSQKEANELYSLNLKEAWKMKLQSS